MVAWALLVSGCSSGGGSSSGFLPQGEIVNVTVLQTTDMHATISGVGFFNDYTPDTTGDDFVLGGWARIATKINEIRDGRRAAGAVVFLVDSGDYNMGTVYDMLWQTNAALRFIQKMEYDVITLGNHEFDYGPQKLATMIDGARNSQDGFTVPIVATNAVFDGANDLEDLVDDGAIINDYYVLTHTSGLKVGVIGLMGKTADDYAPNAWPVTFKSDYENADVLEFIQEKVDALRNIEGVHLVIALSHSGVIDPNGNPQGDDIILAENITGIDIIASGHEHVTTNAVIPVVNGSHTTYIICAGANATNLAQLDFPVNMKTKQLAGVPTLTNHPIDNNIAGAPEINTMVAAMNDEIDAMLTSLGVSLSDVVATSELNLSYPGIAMEFGLGNLLADALRYAGTEATEPTIGAFANGVIRGSFFEQQGTAFADLFAVVPLGITTDDSQDPLLPGYPLLKVYLNGNEVWDICKFDVSIMGAQGTNPQYISYFFSISGLQCTYNYLTGDVLSAGHYAWDDYTCTGGTTLIPKGTATLYPLIVDKYTVDMLLTPSIQGLLWYLGITLQPKLDDGTLINAGNLLDARLDRDPGTPGVQEYYAWSAALKFFTDPAPGGLGETIPEVPYDLSAGQRLVFQ
jgi:2',3'-cyclic-nucleotide 2'-phosphodiesterase (5'-nucleotidase family)